MIAELIVGLIQGLSSAVVEGIGASKQKQADLLLRIEELLRAGADSVATAHQAFAKEDGDTMAALEEARQRIANAVK